VPRNEAVRIELATCRRVAVGRVNDKPAGPNSVVKVDVAGAQMSAQRIRCRLWHKGHASFARLEAISQEG
jgi:hypothetical protein